MRRLRRSPARAMHVLGSVNVHGLARVRLRMLVQSVRAVVAVSGVAIMDALSSC